MTKKLWAILLVAVMVLSLAACGGEEKADESDVAAGNDASVNTLLDDPGYVFKNDESVELQVPATNIDVQSIYDKLTYNERMFMGTYLMESGQSDEAIEEFAASVGLIDFETEYDEKLSTLPYRFEAGLNNLNHIISDITEHEWMDMYFATEDGFTWVTGAYTVSGKQLTFTPLTTYEYDEDAKKITYALSTTSFVYDFEFNGLSVTLSKDGKSVTLRSDILSYEDEPTEYVHIENFLLADSPTIGNIYEFTMMLDPSDNFSYMYVSDEEDNTVYEAIAKLNKNGLFTITIPYETGTVTYQYAAFYCCDDGIILTDGTNTYYYCDTSYSRERRELVKFVGSDITGQIGALSENELEQIAQLKNDLISDLLAKFQEAGIECTYNEASGEFAIDSAILFGGDSAELSAEGKAFLDDFIGAYMEVIMDEKYDGFISTTVVEGHTAPLSGSTYESGLPLSIERAETVRNYCLTSETLDDTELALLSLMLEAEGLSNSRPVLDANGNVDINASRRVSFKFNINLDSYLG